MQSITDAGFAELLALCGGMCSCATCHVYIDPQQLDRLPPVGPDEDGLLAGSGHRRPNSRLACQLRTSDSCFTSTTESVSPAVALMRT